MAATAMTAMALCGWGQATPAPAPVQTDAQGSSTSFVPSAPAGGTRFTRDAAPAIFNWTDGGFERFRVEFSPNPDFSRPLYRENANFSSRRSYTPSAGAWEEIRQLGRCGQPVYWRVVAKIPGAVGVVNADSPSWLAFAPDPAAARVVLDVAKESDLGRPLTFTLEASSEGCAMTGARIDFDGDGWWDALGSSDGSSVMAVSYTYSFDTPGPHIARAEVLFESVPLASATAEIVTLAGPPPADLGSPWERLVCSVAPLAKISLLR